MNSLEQKIFLNTICKMIKISMMKFEHYENMAKMVSINSSCPSFKSYKSCLDDVQKIKL